MGRLRLLLIAALAMATMMFVIMGPAGAQTVTEFEDDSEEMDDDTDDEPLL